VVVSEVVAVDALLDDVEVDDCELVLLDDFVDEDLLDELLDDDLLGVVLDVTYVNTGLPCGTPSDVFVMFWAPIKQAP
jgi:hypothetical protein